jgi:branched-chain amino acid transport system ATP-binding protein
VAARDVDLDVAAGEVVSLIGPNGAGKTTVFNMLTGVYTPTAGRVVLAGRDITGRPPHAVTEAGIGRTFQNIRLFRQMTALENVLVGMHSRTRGGILGSVLGLRRVRQEERRSRERGRELLAFVGLARHAEQYAQNLSYGDQRRLEVARALATEPRLVLLDEPTAGMNPAETAAFIGFVERIRGPEGRAVLLIEHDMKVVMGVSERVVVLDHGEKIAEGPPEEIQRNERVIEAYLGRAATA